MKTFVVRKNKNLTNELNRRGKNNKRHSLSRNAIIFPREKAMFIERETLKEELLGIEEKEYKGIVGIKQKTGTKTLKRRKVLTHIFFNYTEKSYNVD